jgi:polysaccharide biosynthesis/export protein
MRVIRCLTLWFAVAVTAAGCAQPMRVQMAAAPSAPPAPGIDNVVYGAAPGYRTPPATVYGPAAPPVYAAAPPPPSVRAPAYAPAAPVYRGFIGPAVAPAAAGPAPVIPAAMVSPAPPAVVPAGPIVRPVPMAVPFVAPATGAPWVYTLDSGDRLRVVVFGQDGLTNSYVLDASGMIQMPLIGEVLARGLTTDQLSERITGMLRQGFIREPHVAVEIEAYRPFFILGEVLAPGQYPYVANMTAQTAVAIAGGFGPRAYHRQVTVTHVVGGQVYCFEVPMTYAVRPGDTIQVQERWF